MVYPELTNEPINNTPIPIADSLAAWGLDGDYLVVWRLNGLQCCVTVYKTESLGVGRQECKCEGTFEVASTSVTVEMLPESGGNANAQVLIASFGQSGVASLFLCDLKTKKILREMNMSLPVSRNVATSQGMAGSDSTIGVFGANQL